VQYKIAPSLLAADFADLRHSIGLIEEHADLLHLDVMDGHFVPNITFGMPVIAGLRPHTSLLFDCHMMTTNPTAYLSELADAGVDLVTIHLEAVPDPTDAFVQAKELGLDLGLVISPPTPFEAVEPYIEQAAMVLIMSVHPGFGGQSFIPAVLEKVERARKWVDSHQTDTDIQIDGGITIDTIRAARDAGANVFVAGTAVFGSDDPAMAVSRLRQVIEETV
jgi:ribulose-phosphate 3-epimerase